MQIADTEIKAALTAALEARGFSGIEPQLLQIEPPRAWGVATNVCFMLAGQAAAEAVARETAGMSKGEAKKRASEITRRTGEALAREIAAELAGSLPVSGAPWGGPPCPPSEFSPVGRTAVSAKLIESGLTSYRRRLPHWRLPGSVYFVTWRLAPSQSSLPERARDIVLEALRFFAGERYHLYAWVVMDDHVHVLVQPLGELTLEEQVRRWKSLTANRLQRECGYLGHVWLDEYLDRIPRTEQEFWETAQYIVNNPLKRWPEVEDYPWVGWDMEGSGGKFNAADTAVSPTGKLPYIKEVTAEGAYINFYYDPGALAAHVVDAVLAAEVQAPGSFGQGAPVLLPDGRRKRIMVEYAQPNTHKDFHVGHLRNASIGQAIANLLEFAGNEVLKATYIGDVGKHISLALWADRQRRNKDTFWWQAIPGDLTEAESYTFGKPEYWGSTYRMATVIRSLLAKKAELNEISSSFNYKDLLSRFDREINEWLIAWEHKAEPAYSEWLESREHCLDGVSDPRPPIEGLRSHIFPELKVWFDDECWFFESTVSEEEHLDKQAADQLKQLGIATIDAEGEYAGALYVDFSAQADAVKPNGTPVFREGERKRIKQLGKMTILRSDGTSLYQTKELGLAKYKFDNFDIHESLYVVGAEQKLYFEQVFAILRLWGFPNAENCKHISYELVVLPEGKMSSREGNIVSYRDLRDQAIARAFKSTEEKGIAGDVVQTAWDIAIAAIKYAMLAVTGAQQITFDFEQALSFDGRSAPYLQYAYARTRKLVEGMAEGQGDLDSSATPEMHRGLKPALPELHPSEIALARAIARFPQVVQEAAVKYEPATLCTYLYDIAGLFAEFYRDCHVLSAPQPQRNFRQRITLAFRTIMATGFKLLALPLPEEM